VGFTERRDTEGVGRVGVDAEDERSREEED
jgi:hypothetical protein